MRRNANHGNRSRPKKSGNTAAGIPRPTGEGVNHLPGAGAVANRDQVSETPFFVHLVLTFVFILLQVLDFFFRALRPLSSSGYYLDGHIQGLQWAKRRDEQRTGKTPLKPSAVTHWQLISLHAFLPTGSVTHLKSPLRLNSSYLASSPSFRRLTPHPLD